MATPGTWQQLATLVGQTGAAGTSGNSVLNGQSDPNNSQGNVGDFFLNTTSTVLWGPKTSTGWPYSGITLTGQTGSPGANGYNVQSGLGPPSNSLGSNGDIYLDLGNFNAYGKKTGGTWPTTYTNFKGATGTTGSVGPQGNTVLSGSGAPSSSTGNNGDFYINLAGGGAGLYGPKASGSWPATYLNLVGAPGTAGAAGTNGNTILNSTSNPTTQGNVGDFLLNTTTYVLFGPKTASGWPSTGTALIGPQGPSTSATVPNDLTGNSLALAPVSGDSTPVGLTVSSSSGAVFSVSAAGAIVGASTATLTGALSASTTTVGNGSLSAPSATFKNQPDTGMYLVTQSSTAAVIGFSTNAVQTLTIATNLVSCRTTFVASTVTTSQVLVQGGYTASSGMVFSNQGGTGENIQFNMGGTNSALAVSSTGASATPQMYSAKMYSPLYYTQTAGSAAAPVFSYGNQNGLSFAGSPTPATNIIASNSVVIAAAYNAITLSQPTTLTSAATLTANAAVTTAATVTSTTAAGTPSFVSTQGFKAVIDTGVYWTNGTSFATAYTPMYSPIVTPAGTVGTLAKGWSAPFTGSVLAISMYIGGSVGSSTTVYWQLYKNGTATGLSNATSYTGTVPANTSNTANKGTYAFVRGDLLQVWIYGTSATITTAFESTITVEMGA